MQHRPSYNCRSGSLASPDSIGHVLRLQETVKMKSRMPTHTSGDGGGETAGRMANC